MSTSSVNVAIENLFTTGWGVTTPISYDNVAFTPPATAWVSIEVWDGTATPAALGVAPKLRRFNGTVFVTIYTPLTGGSKPARDLAVTAAAIFRGVQVSGITFKEPEVKRVGTQAATINGVQSTTQWYTMVVSIAFFADSVV